MCIKSAHGLLSPPLYSTITKREAKLSVCVQVWVRHLMDRICLAGGLPKHLPCVSVTETRSGKSHWASGFIIAAHTSCGDVVCRLHQGVHGGAGRRLCKPASEKTYPKHFAWKFWLFLKKNFYLLILICSHFILCVWMFASMCVHHVGAVTMEIMESTREHQVLLESELEGLWDAVLGTCSPLQEQSTLLTTGLCLHPWLFACLLCVCMYMCVHGCVCVCMCTCMCMSVVCVSVIVYMWKSECSLWESVLSFYHLGLGIEFRSLDVTSSISPAQFSWFLQLEVLCPGRPTGFLATRAIWLPHRQEQDSAVED